MPQSAGGGVQWLFGQCSNEQRFFYVGASLRWIFQLTLLSIGAFHITRHTMRMCTSPFHWSFAKAFLAWWPVCPELCILYCGSLFRALFLTRDIRESSEVVPAIVDLLLNKTACGYNIIEETKRILRRGSKVIFLFHHWVRIRQTKTNFNRQISPKQPEVGQIFILRSNFGQNKDHMTCKQVRVPLKTDIQQVRGPSKLTSSKLGSLK